MRRSGLNPGRSGRSREARALARGDLARRILFPEPGPRRTGRGAPAPIKGEHMTGHIGDVRLGRNLNGNRRRGGASTLALNRWIQCRASNLPRLCGNCGWAVTPVSGILAFRGSNRFGELWREVGPRGIVGFFGGLVPIPVKRVRAGASSKCESLRDRAGSFAPFPLQG